MAGEDEIDLNSRLGYGHSRGWEGMAYEHERERRGSKNEGWATSYRSPKTPQAIHSVLQHPAYQWGRRGEYGKSRFPHRRG